jgi:hypothetical protein
MASIGFAQNCSQGRPLEHDHAVALRDRVPNSARASLLLPRLDAAYYQPLKPRQANP